MKLLEKLIDSGKITSDELKELLWCCRNYQDYIPSGESCGDACPAHRGVRLIKCYDHADTLCECCTWRLIGDPKIPKELQEYSYIYNLRSEEAAKAHPDFQKFFNKLKEKFEALCKKANRVLQRCHDKYSPALAYCSSCPLQEVCIQM